MKPIDHVPNYFGNYLAHDDVSIEHEWLKCIRGHEQRKAWVMRLFHSYVAALVEDLKFAVCYDVSDVYEDTYIRNSIPEPPDAIVEPFWTDSIGVNVAYAGYKTGLRVADDTAMEPRALRSSLVSLCNDFCMNCEQGNMEPLTLVGTFVDVNEVAPMVRYVTRPKWARGREGCDHAGIAERTFIQLRCLLANIAFETEIRELGLPAQYESRYDCDHAFVLILCDHGRGGVCAVVPLDVWYMIRQMCKHGYTTKKRWRGVNPNTHDWSFLQPLKIDWV